MPKGTFYEPVNITRTLDRETLQREATAVGAWFWPGTDAQKRQRVQWAVDELRRRDEAGAK